VFPSLVDLPVVIPLPRPTTGVLAGFVNGNLIALTRIPPFIATLGMMVSARGAARYYTARTACEHVVRDATRIGEGALPVAMFVIAAVVFYVLLRYTRYGKYTYAIGANAQAARISGIRVTRHLVLVYTVAGLLSGLGGVMTSARAASGQAGMGMSYELDAIAAAVIGGTSLSGGIGRITGTVIGTVIPGVITSGFTFIGFDAYIQDIVKGGVIVLAVVIDRYRHREVQA
jgi:inositol transport system permease protein